MPSSSRADFCFISDQANAGQPTPSLLEDLSPPGEFPYEALLRTMDVLNNETLIFMLRTWYKSLKHTGKINAKLHPHLQKVIQKLS